MTERFTAGPACRSLCGSESEALVACPNYNRLENPSPVRPSRAIGQIHEDTYPIYIYDAVLEQIVDYSESDLRRELGGFLLGGVYEDQGLYVEVRHFLPAVDARSNVASLTIDHDVWARMHRELESTYPQDLVVGWQHTHPGHGVFLSGYDLFIHRHYFDQPWHIALVVDPRRQELRFFQWRGADIVDTGFVCVSDETGRDERG